VPPALIVTNARIATGDPRRPWATALAVDGGTLAAVGSAAEILKLAGPSTRIVNLAGRALELPPGSVVGGALHVILSDEGDVVRFTSTELSS